MKTIIERSDLLKALNHVQSVVERRNTIPILSNVLLEADNGVLALTATDLEIEMRERVEAEIVQAGAITAPAHMLYDIVRKLPDGAQVELATDETGGRLNLVPANQPLLYKPCRAKIFRQWRKMKCRWPLPCRSMICRLIEKTRFAISVEETRYYLNGIYLHVLEDGGANLLRAVATDGHRLARVEMAQPVGADNMPAVIIPRKTVGEVQKLLEEAEGEVSLQVSDTKINFAFAEIVLTSKLIDGKFPDYTRVIPSDNDKTLKLDAKSFAQSVDRVSAISARNRAPSNWRLIRTVWLCRSPIPIAVRPMMN